MYRMCREIVRIWWRWHMLRLAPFLEVLDMREHSSLCFGITLMLTTYIITTKYSLRKRCLLSLVLIRIALIWYWILTSELLFLLVLTSASQKLVSPHSATSLSSFSISQQPTAPCPRHNILFHSWMYGLLLYPFVLLFVYFLNAKTSQGCVFRFLFSVSFSLGSLIYSCWCWGLPSLNIQPSPSAEFQIWFDMAHWMPPREFSYSVIHLLIYSFSIYLKCTRWTLFHSETGRADIIILIIRSVNWGPGRLANVLRVSYGKSAVEQGLYPQFYDCYRH